MSSLLSKEDEVELAIDSLLNTPSTFEQGFLIRCVGVLENHQCVYLLKDKKTKDKLLKTYATNIGYLHVTGRLILWFSRILHLDICQELERDFLRSKRSYQLCKITQKFPDYFEILDKQAWKDDDFITRLFSSYDKKIRDQLKKSMCQVMIQLLDSIASQKMIGCTNS